MAGSPAAERGQEVRRRLLAAAVALIPERGWAAVSTRVLAERAGVTPSVVHYHFPSLPALLQEAAVAAIRDVLAAVGPALASARSGAEVAGLLAGSVRQYTGADPTSLLFVEAYLAATRDDAFRARLGEIVVDFRASLARVLEGCGVAEPAATATVLAATVDGLLLHRALTGDAEAVPAVLRRLVGD